MTKTTSTSTPLDESAVRRLVWLWYCCHCNLAVSSSYLWATRESRALYLYQTFATFGRWLKSDSCQNTRAHEAEMSITFDALRRPSPSIRGGMLLLFGVSTAAVCAARPNDRYQSRIVATGAILGILYTWSTEGRLSMDGLESNSPICVWFSIIFSLLLHTILRSRRTKRQTTEWLDREMEKVDTTMRDER